MWSFSRRFGNITLLAAITLSFVAFEGFAKNMFTRRILRITGNVASKTGRPEMEELVSRGYKVGYNAVIYDNAGILQMLHPRPNAAIVDGLSKVKARCESYNMHFMPMCLDQLTPTSNDLVHAEAFPCKGTKFVVAGGEAKVAADPPVSLKNGGFEEVAGGVPTKWKLVMMAPNVTVFTDSKEKAPGTTGKVSMRVENPDHKGMGIAQMVSVKPWRNYQLKVWIKTSGLEKARDVGFEVIGGGRYILCNRYNRGVAPTQNWKQHVFDFASLECTSVKVVLAVTHAWTGKGKVWLDDCEIVEAGLYENVRRTSLPVVVKSESGTVYQEGKDYTIQTPPKIYKGQSRLMIPAGSRIKNGEVLRVDWYLLANARTETPGASFCHPSVWDNMLANAKAASKAWGSPKGWFNKINSEWALAYWDPACQKAHPAGAGPYMGAISARIHELMKQATGKSYVEPYLWSDMSDPYHNGDKDLFYMVNGPVTGSWNTMDRQSVIVNWNEGHKYQSMKFFAGMDPKYRSGFYRQICSFWSGTGASGWLSGLKKLEAEGMKDGSVIGMMYTTWHSYDGGYKNIENFAAAAKGDGRWATNPYNPQPVGVRENTEAATPVASNLRVKGMGIRYSLSHDADVKLDLVNVKGQLVKPLVRETQKAGQQELTIGKNALASGVYFVRLQIGNGVDTKAMTRKVVVF